MNQHWRLALKRPNKTCMSSAGWRHTSGVVEGTQKIMLGLVDERSQLIVKHQVAIYVIARIMRGRLHRLVELLPINRARASKLFVQLQAMLEVIHHRFGT